MYSSFAASAGRLVAVVAVSLWAATAAAESAGPFTGLDGVWRVRGQIHLANGSRENLHCRATYRVDAGGTAMHQALRCASHSYKFELRSDVESQGNEVSGNWSELTRSLGGNLSGKARPGRIDVRV